MNNFSQKNSLRTYLLLFLSCILFVSLVVFFSGCTKDPENPGNLPSDELIDSNIVKEVVFHDQGDVYLSDFEPTDSDAVTVRLRIRRGNATNVYVEWTTELDKTSADTITWQKAEMQFDYTDANEYYDYYKGTIPAQPSAYRYHFVIENNVETVYYAGRNAETAKKNEDGSYTNPFDGFSNDFLIQVNFSTPDWSKGTLWYSAMPDSFFNGDPTNDKYGGAIGQTPWGAVHSGGLDYFGGDLQGLYEKISYLQELNCTGLFINPIWLVNHNAGYGFFDGTLIDSTFGNEQLLKELTNELHDNEIRIMFDGVFNYFIGNSKYVNSSSLWPTEGKASSDSSSKYYDVFMRDSSGNLMTNQFGYVVDFASEDAQKLIYSAADSIMQYYILNCGIDGWRLDSAILYTASDGRTGTQIIQDMRKYLKDVAPDSLLCLENANEAGMYTDYAADTYWNQRFLSAVKAFINGDVNKSTINLLSSNLYEAVLGLPRAVAHSSYNMLTNHDEDRILYLMDGDVQKAQALYLMVMTYMGSPTIFYGEETGMDSANRFFVGMNWDRSTWNYDIYNQIKALSQFRAENEALFKYGILENMGVDETNLLLKYRRSYGETQMLTVLNPTGEVKSGVEIDVHSMEIKDGEKVYDYLSGNSYTVSGGKVTVTVMPYGMLLTNKSGNAWAGKWEISGSGTGSVRQTGAASYAVEGEGSMSKNRYAQMPIYNNAGLELSAEGNVIAVMQSAKEGGNYYGVEIRGTEVIVKAKNGGTEEEVTRFTIQAGEKLKIVRGDDNRFTVERNGEAVSGSEKYVEAGYEMYGGIGALSGSGSVNGLQITEEELQKGTEFESGSDSMMETKGEAGAAEIADGVLRLKGTESGVYRLTHAPMRDFSIKTELSGSPQAAGDAMGLTVWQSENCFIFAGRAFIGGSSKLVLGMSLNGQKTIYGQIADVPGKIILQLERVGAYWTAQYKLQEADDFTLLAEGMCCNFSDMYAGVFNQGKGTAEYEYFCFGDAIHDGESYSAHAGYGYREQSSQGSASYGLVSYQTSGGQWAMVNGGFAQNSATAETTTLKTNQGNFRGFRADYSVLIKEADLSGSVSLRFGSDYSLKLYPSGRLELLSGTQLLGNAQLDLPDEPLRIMAVMTDGGVLSVYVGVDMQLAIYNEQMDAAPSPVYFEGNKAAYEIHAMQIQGYTMSHSTATATEFVATMNVKKIRQTNILNRAELGFVFGGSVKCGKEGAMFAGINSRREAYIEYEGERLASVQLPDAFDEGNIYLTLVVRDGKIMLFADSYSEGDENGKTDYSTTPILEYSEPVAMGGVVALYSANGDIEYNRFQVYGLNATEDYTETEIFTNRILD